MSLRAAMNLPFRKEPLRIICDGCGFTKEIKGIMPTWLMDNKAVPKWAIVRNGDEPRRDYCPQCRLQGLPCPTVRE